MSEVRVRKANEIIPAIIELLAEGKVVRMTVTGMSMYPFLRGNKDSVELINTQFSDIRVGDIILIKRDNGEYILHRVIKKKKDYIYLNGDAQQWCEGPIYSYQVVAKVITVWRKDHGISCSSKGWRFFSILWRMVFPLRYLLIKTYGCKHRLLRLIDARRIL